MYKYLCSNSNLVLYIVDCVRDRASLSPSGQSCPLKLESILKPPNATIPKG